MVTGLSDAANFIVLALIRKRHLIMMFNLPYLVLYYILYTSTEAFCEEAKDTNLPSKIL